MKATGIVRRIDDLGRVVIPKEIRRTMRIREGDPLEIYTDNDGEVIFKKYSPIGELSAFATQYAEVLSKIGGYPVVVCDRDHVISVAGIPKKELLERRVSPALEEVMEQLRGDRRRQKDAAGGGRRPLRAGRGADHCRGRRVRQPDVHRGRQPRARHRHRDQAHPGGSGLPRPPDGGITVGKKHKDGPVEELSGRDKVRVSRLVEHMIAIPPSRTDPNGSYTGRPMNKYEVPVQDADDL